LALSDVESRFTRRNYVDTGLWLPARHAKSTKWPAPIIVEWQAIRIAIAGLWHFFDYRTVIAA
jgi:hypothetical protein